MNPEQDYYWSVDLVGLTEDGARQIAAYSDIMNFAEGASVVDPKYFFTGHLDVETVKGLIAALQISLTGKLLPSDMGGMESMLESFQEWLQQASKSEGLSSDGDLARLGPISRSAASQPSDREW